MSLPLRTAVPTPDEYARMAWSARRRAWERIITARDHAAAEQHAAAAAAARLLAQLEPEPSDVVASRRDALPGWKWRP